jgi:hypothetical protein
MVSLSQKLAWCVVLAFVTTLFASSGPAPRAGAMSPGANVPLCQRFVAPNGNDRNRGDRRSPFASVSRLVAGLRAGQTGCLLSGRYKENVSITRAGRPKSPITLRAAPGAKATICGRVEFKSRADYWRLAHLNVDGSCSSENTIQIYGDHITLSHNDITNRHSSDSCMYIGGAIWGRARKTVIRNNRIHDCGDDGNGHTHGIYADAPRQARITDNYIYANSGFGIQLYPDAQETLVEHNVIDGNLTQSGLVFAGEAPYASSHNLVRWNIFSGNGGYGVSSSWAASHVGAANIANGNCFWQNARGPFDSSQVGYRARKNVDANPLFVDRAARDYRLRPGSPCKRMQPRGHVGP